MVSASFANSFDRPRAVAAVAARRCLQPMAWLLPLLVLAACGQQAGYGPGGARSHVEIGADGWRWRAPSRYYPPPGPSEDPWGPYIREAATRYRVPERWVRAVMQQESGGQEQATSPVGAMGLMQVMPTTYEELRLRHRLGDDPYDPHNNILAGTAYIREMYDRYGAPGFLAAYNAGPDRVDRYLAGASDLPDETVNYVAAITPNLGRDVPLSGPFARYASARSGRPGRFAPSVASLAAGCDLNAAYDPNHPCTSLVQAATQPAPARTVVAQETGIGGCDLNAAYDPNHPCTTAAQPAGAGVLLASAEDCDPDAAFNPDRPCRAATTPRITRPARVQPVSVAYYHDPMPRHGLGRFAAAGSAHTGESPSDEGWGIQVGAFANRGLARAVAEGARAQAPHQLRAAAVALPPTPYRGSVLYRARLVHLSASAASNACVHLNQRQLPCTVVRPSES